MSLPNPTHPDPRVQRNFREIERRFPLQQQDISDGAVGTEQIADDAVTGAKLSLTSSRTAASGSLTLTTTPQDVPACTYTTTVAGTYLVIGSFQFVISVAGPVQCFGTLDVDGVDEAGLATYGPASTGTANVSQNWIVSAGAGDVIKLQASKLVDAGTASAGQTHTTQTVIQIG